MMPPSSVQVERGFDVRSLTTARAMNFSDKTLTLLVLIALGLSGLALIFSALGGGRRRKEQAGPLQMDDVLRGVLEGHARHIQKIEQAVRALNATDHKQQAEIEGAVRHVGLVRYDAFEDVGGRLSFSCAMLDDHANGVVVTSINGRQDTRVYAKPVHDRKSPYNVSVEEEEAIRQALAGPREAVTAT
jgi:Protein of unknown function (DUF4446)